MSTTHGYGRGSTDKQTITMKVQAQMIEDYYKARLQARPTDWGGVYADAATSSDIPLVDRPAGRKLHERLRPGDHVVIVDLDRAFRNFREAVDQLSKWHEQGIVVHVVSKGIDTSTEVGILILSILAWVAQVEKAMIRERTRRAAKLRKARSGLTNQFAGYGFRVEGIKGHRRIVADPKERAVMERIVVLHDVEHYRFEDIWLLFIKENIRTRKGKPWSKDRIFRAWKAQTASCNPAPSASPATPTNSTTASSATASPTTIANSSPRP